MRDQELVDALTERLRVMYEPATQRIRERQAKEAALSDGEWWEGHLNLLLKHWSDGKPEMAERLTSMKEEAIRQRKARDWTILAMDANDVARQKAEELMPALLAVRGRDGAEGPITEDQFHEASIRAAQETSAQMLQRMEAAAEREANPRRRSILSQFASNGRIDLTAMATLADPVLTEERLEEVTNGIASRMNALTDAVRDPKD